MLTGKKVTLCISGSIAAYKMATVASMLVKMHCDVRVVLTQNAAQFITPVTFETLTKNPCMTDTFERLTPVEIHHLTLAQTADAVLVAPASADVLAKMAYGIADDLLTSVVVAATCPVLVAPAMNTHMYQNPIVQDNIKRLKSFGFAFVDPEVGRLACEEVGVGKLAEETELVDAIVAAVGGGENLARKSQTPPSDERDFCGLRVLVTAGPTRESLDPVRFLTNHSSGRMGYAVAERAMRRGADVTLVSGPVGLPAPEGVLRISVTTAEEMYREVMARQASSDFIIKAAAVADYRPKQVNAQKTKKSEGELVIELERTRDILAELGKRKGKHQCLCGFSMETEHVLENSRAKRKKKNADLIAANSIQESGAGFGGDTNHLVLISDEMEQDLGMLTKEACADRLLDALYLIWKQKQG